MSNWGGIQIIAAMTLAATGGGQLLLAAAPRAARAGEVEAVCGSLGDEGSSSSAASSASATSDPQAANDAAALEQKKQYCQAAKSAEEAANADGIMWKVWAAVAGVCATCCAASLAGAFTNEYVCIGASLAGGITDAIVTKEFMGLMMALMGAGTSLMMMQKSGGDTASDAASGAASSSSQSKDIGACLSAATAAMQVYMKKSSEDSHLETMKSNLESAKAVQSEAAAASSGSATQQALADSVDMSGAGADSGGASQGVADGGATTSSTQSGPARPCTAARTSGIFNAQIACATSGDRNLPSFVRTPKFVKEFGDKTGIPLPEFMNQSTTPTQALTAAMGASMSQANVPKLADALGKAEAKVRGGAVPDAMYAGGGGGGGFDSGGGGGGDEMGGLGEMMAGLMAQLDPNAKKGEGDDPMKGVRAIAFASKNRSPAQVAAMSEDPRHSIFDRISYRYLYLTHKHMVGGGP